MRLTRIACGVEAEALKTPFGFKGNALTCLWQVAVTLEAGDLKAVGLGVQSVLWSDAKVFARYGEQQGNMLMYRVTQYALRLLAQEEIDTPAAVQERIFDGAYRYAVEITGMPSLSKTFVRNALVSVDMALCQLWIRNRKTDFDALWPLPGQRQKLLANVPLITYGTPVEEAVRLAKGNTPLLKIKIGSDPQKDGSISKMVQWDKERLLQIHEAVKDIPALHTENGHVLYYLDANGRYDSMDTLRSLLNFADAHGILERTVLLEEPFPEESLIDVSGLPVCVAADESVHGMAELRLRRELGYGALTLKPIAKGISASMEMAQFAADNGMHCFCADLTVNPVMVTWNMCVAARLNRLPGMRVGIVESNGSQNYSRWETLKTYHPMAGSGFLEQTEGVYRLDDAFWQQSGGIFEIPPYYWNLGSREVLWNGE